MPKYYVTIIDTKIIVSANDPLSACVKASMKNGIISAGLYWKVSEKGFDEHFDDELIDDHLILKELQKYNKGEDNEPLC